MKDSSKLSRRDWFRLGKSARARTLGEQQQTVAGNNALQPIEHPPNHDQLDLSELPPMRQAVLSREQVEALFSDIGYYGTEIQLMKRDSPTAQTAAGNVKSVQQLECAKNALFDGSVSRVQIRYRWQQILWIDTLKVDQGGYHIVRIAHQKS